MGICMLIDGTSNTVMMIAPIDLTLDYSQAPQQPTEVCHPEVGWSLIHLRFAPKAI
jgi:hypothetical protein